MKLLLCSLIIGAVAGLFGALCGVGGGIVMVPAFAGLLGMEQKQAVATSLAVILASSAIASLANSRHGLIDWKIAGLSAIAAMAAAWFGSDLMRSLSNEHLSRIFALVLIALGLTMLFR